jgi:chromosome segregation ATPase
MGSTAKILFGSFLAICFVGMFLLFSMQKSAQLTLDKEAIQLVSNQKNTKITSINDALTASKAIVEEVQTQNKRIPELETQLETTEKEKLVYVQQLDDFQAELQNQVDIAEQRLSQIRSLQEQQNSSQLSLTDTSETLAAVELQNNELAAALEITLGDVENKAITLQELTETLLQKDRVIQIYKEKLDKAAEDIQLFQTADSNEQLNLKLILDELAVKSALASELSKKLEQAAINAMVSGTEGNVPSSTNNENQLLIERLSLENDFLGSGMKEQNEIIRELETNLAATKELLASFDAEIEQLQFLATEKETELKNLQLQATGSEQELNQLTATLTAREKEIVAVKEQTMGIAAPLTEKITGLELQITQAANQNTTLADELSQEKSVLSSLQDEKQIINDELASAQVALETTQNKLTETKEIQTALQENVSNLEQQLVSTEEAQALLTTELENKNTLASEKESAINELTTQLEEARSQNLVIGTEQEERISRLIDEVAAAKAVSTELTEQASNLQERNEELLAALAAKEEEVQETEANETETEVTSEPEGAPQVEVEVEVVDEQPEVIVIETEQTSEEELNAVETEEAVAEEVETETVSDESSQVETEPVIIEEIPLQEDATNEENM